MASTNQQERPIFSTSSALTTSELPVIFVAQQKRQSAQYLSRPLSKTEQDFCFKTDFRKPTPDPQDLD